MKDYLGSWWDGNLKFDVAGNNERTHIKIICVKRLMYNKEYSSSFGDKRNMIVAHFKRWLQNKYSCNVLLAILYWISIKTKIVCYSWNQNK